MFALYAAMSAFLMLNCVFIPVSRYERQKRSRDFHEAFEWAKLRAIKRHYPSVRDMSFDEMRAKLDIDDWYNKIR